MSAESSIRRGQAAAEREMTLVFNAFEPSGTTTDADGYKVPAYTPRGTVAGKIQAPSTQGRDTHTRYVTIGEVERPIWEAGLHLPITAEIPKPGRQRGIGWEYEVAEVGQADDPALLGFRVLVVEVPFKSKATARRLNVVEVN